jgi:hypothetical protein
MFGSSPDPAPERWEPPVGGAIAEPTVPALIALLGLRACRYESFPFDGLLPRIEPGKIVLPADEPGVASWSGEAGVELPVRHGDLTLGRYVLVPSSPTTGIGLSVTARAEAMALAADVGARLAAALVAEDEGSPTPGNPEPSSAETSDHARPSDHTRHGRRSARGRRGVE